MNKKIYKSVLIAQVALCLFYLITLATKDARAPESANKPVFTPQDFVVVLPTPTPRAQYDYKRSNRVVNYYNNWFLPNILDGVTIPSQRLELTDLGYYYLTAYCPYECGFTGSNYPIGWQTASGLICNYADYENRYTDYTTCAVDPSLHRIGSEGDLFYIPDIADRIYQAHDTGGAVKNKHLDLFYVDYASVVSFPTGWYKTYSVKVVNYTFTAGYYRQLRQKSLIGELELFKIPPYN